jgi:hypothetical protein
VFPRIEGKQVVQQEDKSRPELRLRTLLPGTKAGVGVCNNSLKEQSVAKEDRGESKLCGRKTKSEPDTQTADPTPGTRVV